MDDIVGIGRNRHGYTNEGPRKKGLFNIELLNNLIGNDKVTKKEKAVQEALILYVYLATFPMRTQIMLMCEANAD